jgi:hypothetical protein
LRPQQHERKSEHSRKQRNIQRYEIRQREDQEQDAEAAIAQRVTECTETDAVRRLGLQKLVKKSRRAPAVRRSGGRLGARRR